MRADLGPRDLAIAHARAERDLPFAKLLHEGCDIGMGLEERGDHPAMQPIEATVLFRCRVHAEGRFETGREVPFLNHTSLARAEVRGIPGERNAGVEGRLVLHAMARQVLDAPLDGLEELVFGIGDHAGLLVVGT